MSKYNCWHCKNGMLVSKSNKSSWVKCDSCGKEELEKVAEKQNIIKDLAYSDLAISDKAQLLLDINVPNGIEWEDNKYYWVGTNG